MCTLSSGPGRSVARFELAGLVREVGLFILMILIAGMLLVAEVFFLNHIGTLASASVEGSTPPAATNQVPPAPGTEETASTEATDLTDVAELDPEALKAQLDDVCRYDDSVPALTNVAGFTSGAPSIGSDTAGVAIIEFFDPNCPALQDAARSNADHHGGVGRSCQNLLPSVPDLALFVHASGSTLSGRRSGTFRGDARPPDGAPTARRSFNRRNWSTSQTKWAWIAVNSVGTSTLANIARG